MSVAGKTAIVRVVTDQSGFTLAHSRTELALLAAQAQFASTMVNTLRASMTIGGISIAGLILPSVLASKAVGTFQQELAMAAAIAEDPAFKNNMDEITTKVRDLAIEYGVSSDTIAEGVKQFTKIGYDYATVMNELLTPTVQLASANLMSMSEAVATTNKLWNVFGQKGGYTAYDMLNKIHYAANLSAIDVDKLATTVKNTSSTYAIANVSMEEWITTAAALSMHGIEMSARQGTLTSQILSNSEKFMKVMKNNRLVMDGELDWTSFMKQLSMIETGSQQYSDLVNLFGAGRSGRSIHELKASADWYLENLEKIQNANDTLKDQADTMAGTIPALFEKIREVAFAPLKSTTMMDKLVESLNVVQHALESESFTAALYQLVDISTVFLTNTAPEMIRIFSSLLYIISDLSPMMNFFANAMSAVGETAAFLGKNFMLFLISMSVAKRHIGPLLAGMSAMHTAGVQHNIALNESATRQSIYNNLMQQGIGYTALLTSAKEADMAFDLRTVAIRRGIDVQNATAQREALLDVKKIMAANQERLIEESLLRIQSLQGELAASKAKIAMSKTVSGAKSADLLAVAALEQKVSSEKTFQIIQEHTLIQQLRHNKNAAYLEQTAQLNALNAEWVKMNMSATTYLGRIKMIRAEQGLLAASISVVTNSMRLQQLAMFGLTMGFFMWMSATDESSVILGSLITGISAAIMMMKIFSGEMVMTAIKTYLVKSSLDAATASAIALRYALIATGVGAALVVGGSMLAGTAMLNDRNIRQEQFSMPDYKYGESRGGNTTNIDQSTTNITQNINDNTTNSEISYRASGGGM